MTDQKELCNAARKRVLVTGHEGYIGSVLTGHLVAEGFDVVGIDTGYFRSCTLGPEPAPVPTIRKDIRDVEQADLDGFDAVVHLAALSNDPIGNLNDSWTTDINYLSSGRLAQMAKDAGVSRFLFASSCIMYGMSSTSVVDEDSPLDPQTEYARSKVLAEHAISQLAGDGFSPIFARNGTVYGFSPRMRLDTVLNSLVASALVTGKITVLSDGKPWRPVVHILDLVRTFQLYLEAPIEAVHNQAFNNGAECLNRQVVQLAQAVAETVPGASLEVMGQADADQRTYKADFSKFARTFPEFQFQWTPELGARQLYESLVAKGFGREHYDGPSYVRLRRLRQMLETGQLDDDLRWSEDSKNNSTEDVSNDRRREDCAA